MELNEVVTGFGALAQPARLQVFRLLVKAGDEGMCAGDLSREMGIPKNTMSFHLKELVNAKLISSERNGRSITYTLHKEGIRQLLQFLMEDCCQGRPDLCFPDACAEDSCLSQ